MRPLRRWIFLVLLICQMATLSSAQRERILAAPRVPAPNIGDDAAGSGLSPGDFLLKTNVSEVEVHFAVFDSAGQLVPKLEAQDVKIIADGKYSPKIKSFGTLRAAPVTLGIVVDLSESVHPEMHGHVVEFSEAVSKFLRPAQDLEFVVAFSNRVSLLQPPTSDFAQVKKALERSTGDQNLTSLYDAIVKTCREQFGHADHDSDNKRVLLVFTDGVDNLSFHTLDDAIDEAIEAGVVIYAVAEQGGDVDGRRVLEQLTGRTGGMLELLRKSQDPELSIASVRGIAAGEYSLSFQPPISARGFHALELKAVSQPSLVLRTRKAYYLDSHP
jgi:VWFA-related protein